MRRPRLAHRHLWNISISRSKGGHEESRIDSLLPNRRVLPHGKDMNRSTSHHLLRDLHRHFFHKVVPRFRWIDLPDNPWRNTIKPVAQYSLCLQLAMASHAAAHLSITWMGSDHE
ncbi:hypothetical protein BDV12DRAFT_103881 [Aspergillus spectabilis]